MSYSYPEVIPEPMYQPPRGLSSTAKVLIILGVFAGGVLVVCCGLGGALFYWGKKSFVTDPEQVAAGAREIADIAIPEPFLPSVLMDMRVPFTGRRLMMMAFYHHPETESSITLMGFDLAADEQQRRDIQRSMEEAARQRSNEHGREVVPAEAMRHAVTIGGQEVEFSILRVKTADGRQRVLVAGEFPGRFGQATLQVDADESILPKEKLEALLNSIR